jgi:threonine dehydrogenase-like Zn-dependent dehydrogenase
MSLFRAVLAEPTSIVLTGLTRVNWQGARTVLVIGAGTIGLLSLWALASLYPSLQCHVLARYPNQASLASQLGASSVWEDIGQLQPAGLLGVVKKGRFGAADYGSWGFDVVVDAVGSTASIRQSLLLTRPGGQVLMLGGAGQSQQDLAPFWVRNLTWHGTFGYQHGGHSHFPEALALLNETSLPVETIVTDMVPLEEFSSGLARIFRDRGSVIKMVWKIPDNKDTL